MICGPRGLFLLLRILAILGLLVAYLRYLERHTVFHPMKEIEYLPGAVGLEFEDVSFKTADNVEIGGWFIPRRGARRTVIFCYGNAGNISHRIEKLKFFNELGHNVLIFDYRGYGKSSGRPYEKGLYLDAQAAYGYLLSRKIAPEDIIGYGESLGGAVIIDLAAKRKMKGLIVDSSMSSARDMVKAIYPFLPYWLFASRFDSANKLKSLDIPKLIIHSVNDEIVPYRQGLKLYEQAAKPKEFLEIHGGHNSGFFESEKIIKERVADFLKRI